MLTRFFFQVRQPFSANFMMTYGGRLGGGKVDTNTSRCDKINLQNMSVQNSFQTLTLARGDAAIGISKKSGGMGHITGGENGAANPPVMQKRHETALIITGGTVTNQGDIATAVGEWTGACSDVYYYCLGGLDGSNNVVSTIYKKTVSNVASVPLLISSTLVNVVGVYLEATATESYIFVIGAVFSGTAQDFSNMLLLQNGSGAVNWWTMAVAKQGRTLSGNESKSFEAGGTTDGGSANTINTIFELSNMSKSKIATWGTLVTASYERTGASSQWRTAVTQGNDTIATAFTHREYFNHETKGVSHEFDSGNEAIESNIPSDSGNN